jgi:hypothetical protein
MIGMIWMWLASAAAGNLETPERVPDKVVNGALAAGKVIDLAWAASSSVACFPATAFDAYRGTHQFFRLEVPPNKDLVVRVSSSTGSDLSLYALQRWHDRESEPPAISRAWRCNAAHATTSGELLKVTGYKTPIPVLLGVAGAGKGEVGDFKLEIWEEKGRQW